MQTSNPTSQKPRNQFEYRFESNTICPRRESMCKIWFESIQPLRICACVKKTRLCVDFRPRRYRCVLLLSCLHGRSLSGLGGSLAVGHVREHAKTAEPIEMPFGGWLVWAQVTMHQMRIQIPQGNGHFCELSVIRPVKKALSYCCGVCSKEINNGISATAAADCIALDWAVSH